MIQALPSYTFQLAEMERSLQELKKLVSMGWIYAVIWKIGPDHRTPVWHQGFLNESLAGAEVGSGERFESIYKQCQFTTPRPGYAYLAWQRQSPFWWTRLMEPVLTDKSKELFLSQAGIQTIVCFPGRAIPDGTGYCVELACTALVAETEFLRTSIQEFLNTSIDPYISTPLLQEVPATLDIENWRQSSTSEMAALAHQTSAILTDITSQASMGENEAIEGFSNILRREEPYSSWTMSSTHFVSPEAPNFQAYEEGVANYPGFHDVSFNYETAPLLSELFEGANIQTQPASSEWASSRKGKDIEESDLVLVTGKQTTSSQNVSLLQQELLEKLRSPPSAPPGNPEMLPSGIGSSYRRIGPVGKMPPGHSPASLFRPHNGRQQFPRFGVSKRKRLPLIYKWATSLVPWKKRIRDEAPGGDLRGAGGSSIDSLSPGTDLLDPRSPNSVAHARQAAVAHRDAERHRRSIFRHKLQTLIAIVPMINKKKDKVSVLTSTIDYIRQLNLRISTLKNGEDEEAAAPSTSRLEVEGAATTLDREEELTTGNEAGPSSSSPPIGAIGGAPVVVVVEYAPGEDTWVIEVEANYHSRSLIQLLSVLLDLELGVVTVDYRSTNGRFHANLCVKNLKSSITSRSELQATLCRVLETGNSSPTGSD